MEIKQTPATAAIGCGGTLILLGSFISGFYLGHLQARGQTVDTNMMDVLKYGPAVIGGAYSLMTSNAVMSVPGNLEQMVDNVATPPGASPEQKTNAVKGCMPVMSGLFGSAAMGLVTYLGYAVGSAMAK